MDGTRRQLKPIRTLTALTDSFARESLHITGTDMVTRSEPMQSRFCDSPLEVAYLTRWIELDGGRELHGWRILCQRAR